MQRGGSAGEQLEPDAPQRCGVLDGRECDVGAYRRAYTSEYGSIRPFFYSVHVPSRVPRNEARQAILDLALNHLASRGAANVHPKEICEALGLSKALVNYHFGGRDGLITEAMVLGYERYVDHLWDAAQAVATDPLGQLLAWIDAQVEWTTQNAGLAAALNFPFMASGLPLSLDESSVERINAAGRRNFENLQQLVGAARASVRPTEGTRVDPVQVGLDSAVIGWMTLGLSVWRAGQHLPTQRLEERSRLGVAWEHVHAEVRAIIER